MTVHLLTGFPFSRSSEGSSPQDQCTEPCVLDAVAGLGAEAEDDMVPALEGVTLTGWTDPQTDTFRGHSSGGVGRNGRAGNESFSTLRRCFHGLRLEDE